MTITVEEIRTITDRLCSHLEELNIRKIDIDHDYYSTIDEKQLYDPTKQPDRFALGQLSSDLEEMRAIVAGKPTITFAFTWFAAILRVVGETIVR